MQRITPHLWFDTEAVEATEFYAATFPDSKVTSVSKIQDTPSGDCDIVSLELCGQPFMAISAGPHFQFSPEVSFMVRCSTREQVDELWAKLSAGGTTLMPLDSYLFSERYGWTTDRFGLSWQLSLDPTGDTGQKIVPSLLFVGEVCGKAEAAAAHYKSLFPDSKTEHIDRYPEGDGPDAPGTVRYLSFLLNGQRFAAMDSALPDHDFSFHQAVSFMIECETQEEIDHYWDGLSAVPEAEQCGWLADRFGLPWQVVPTALGEAMSQGTDEQRARVTEAFLKMKKFDLAEIKRAYEGADTSV